MDKNSASTSYRERWLTRGKLTSHELATFVVIYAAVTFLQFFVLGGIGDECRGTEVAYLGGCPQHTAAAEFQAYFFFVADLVLMVSLLIILKRMSVARLYRLIALVLYALFVFVGPAFLFRPTPASEGRLRNSSPAFAQQHYMDSVLYLTSHQQLHHLVTQSPCHLIRRFQHG